MAQATKTSSGPPYLNTAIASNGGVPTVHQDVPVCAVLIAIYLVAAISHMTIYQINKRKGHRFFMSCAMFGFCMSRVLTSILRLVWANKQNDVHVAIAAQIFTNVGVLVIYIILLLLALRVFRATHPKLGWNRYFRKALTVSYALLLVALLLTIAFTVLTYYTLNMKLKSIALWIQRGSILYMMLFNIASLTLLLLSALLPRASNNENFGTGSITSKLIILSVALFFAVFIAGFRMGAAWANARLASDPGWYQTKPAFYVILFGFEIIVAYLLLLTRFDRRFWVPNGSDKPGDYSQIDHEGSVGSTTSAQTSVQVAEQTSEKDKA